jgi:hypothetical protein
MVCACSLSGKSITVDEGLAVLKRLEDTVEELDFRAIKEKGQKDASGVEDMADVCEKLRLQLERVIAAVRHLLGKNEGMCKMLQDQIVKLKGEVKADDDSDGFIDRTMNDYDVALMRFIKYYKYSENQEEVATVLVCTKKLLARVYRDGIEGESELCMICKEGIHSLFLTI